MLASLAVISVVWKVDGKLDGLNNFMREEIRENFFHTKRSDWNLIKRE